MTKRIDPLGREPITDERGRASQFFAVQWNNLRAFFDAIQVGDLSTILAAVSQVATNTANITALLARQIIAGTGLTGGGTLSSDVTVELESGVATPGTYGDATNVPQVTVDTHGRVTGVTVVPITGGGGGDSLVVKSDRLKQSSSSASISAYAFKGNEIQASEDISVAVVSAYFVAVNGADYKAVICEYDGADEIQSVVSSAGRTLTDTTAQWHHFYFETPADLTAGVDYAVMVGRTDDADNYAMPVLFGIPQGDDNDDILDLPVVMNQGTRLDNADPTAGQTLDGGQTSKVAMGVTAIVSGAAGGGGSGLTLPQVLAPISFGV